MTAISRLRLRAFGAQHGRSFYCGLPMWLASPKELARPKLRERTLAALRCTAEHLMALSSGGKSTPDNIAAACWRCNHERHKRKDPRAPEAHRDFVRARLARGKWHPPSLHQFR